MGDYSSNVIRENFQCMSCGYGDTFVHRNGNVYTSRCPQCKAAVPGSAAANKMNRRLWG